MKQGLVNRKKSFLPYLIFVFFFLIFISSSGGHVDSYDGVSYFLITENFVLNGSPSININSPSASDMGFVEETYIKDKSRIIALNNWEQSEDLQSNMTKREYIRITYDQIDKEAFFGPAYLVLPLVAVPLYMLASALQVSPIHFVPLFLNSSIIAASAVVVFLIGKTLFHSERIGFTVSLIFGLTSFMWPYITSMWARPLAILFLLIIIYLILRSRNSQNNMIPFFVGICIGLSVLTHITFLALAPGLIIFGVWEFRKKKKHLIFLVVGLLIMIGIQLYSNDYRFGDMYDFGFGGTQNYVGKAHTFEGLYGFLFSPGLSIFLYFPAAILYIFALYYLYKKNRSITLLFIYLTLATYIPIAISAGWYWNPNWGPHRYLLTLTPIIAISIGSIMSEFPISKFWKLSIILSSIGGFFVNLLGNLVWPQYALSYGWGPEGIWKSGDIPSVFTWDPYYSPIVQTIKVLSTDWVASLDPNPVRLTYFKIGLNGCSYDIFLFCEYGIVIMIVLGIIIASISYVILKLLKRPIDLKS